MIDGVTSRGPVGTRLDDLQPMDEGRVHCWSASPVHGRMVTFVPRGALPVGVQAESGAAHRNGQLVGGGAGPGLIGPAVASARPVPPIATPAREDETARRPIC